MKKIYILILAAIIGTNYGIAQTICAADETKSYLTTNAGWSNSDWYEIINIDAQQLGSIEMAKHSGSNGSNTSSNFSSGSFTTPIMAWSEELGDYQASNVNWPVNYNMTCLSADFFNSAYTKVEMLGTKESGQNDPCYDNNNQIVASPIWDKQGFIELSRLAEDANNPGVSRHGYIEIDNLPAVERVQWSFSSTAWKRGFKLDIKHGDGEWEQLHWEASDISQNILSFSEQGYQFEEIIGEQEQLDSYISLRWRIWDGDTTSIDPTKEGDVLFARPVKPLAQWQVVRVHQIKIFSGITPESGPNAVINTKSEMRLYRSGDNMVSNKTGQFDVYGVDGKLVKSAQGDRINLSNVGQGIYILKMNANDGGTLVRKVIL